MVDHEQMERLYQEWKNATIEEPFGGPPGAVVGLGGPGFGAFLGWMWKHHPESRPQQMEGFVPTIKDVVATYERETGDHSPPSDFRSPGMDPTQAFDILAYHAARDWAALLAKEGDDLALDIKAAITRLFPVFHEREINDEDLKDLGFLSEPPRPDDVAPKEWITRKALQYQECRRTFDLGGFMAWIEAHDEATWFLWACPKRIKTLDMLRRRQRAMQRPPRR